MLSQGLIGVSQKGHLEEGVIIDNLLGILYMHTLRNEPTTEPNTKVMIYTNIWGFLFLELTQSAQLTQLLFGSFGFAKGFHYNPIFQGIPVRASAVRPFWILYLKSIRKFRFL